MAVDVDRIFFAQRWIPTVVAVLCGLWMIAGSAHEMVLARKAANWPSEEGVVTHSEYRFDHLDRGGREYYRHDLRSCTRLPAAPTPGTR